MQGVPLKDKVIIENYKVVDSSIVTSTSKISSYVGKAFSASNTTSSYSTGTVRDSATVKIDTTKTTKWKRMKIDYEYRVTVANPTNGGTRVGGTDSNVFSTWQSSTTSWASKSRTVSSVGNIATYMSWSGNPGNTFGFEIRIKKVTLLVN